MPIPRMFKNDSPDPELENYNPRLAQIYVIQEVATKFSLEDIDSAIMDGYPNMHVAKRLRPLHVAAFLNDVERVTRLVQIGATIDAIDEVGYTPLHYCAIFGRLEALEELICHGARTHFDQSSLPPSRQTNAEQPIRLAMECNQAKCADVLLKNGAKPDTEYHRGHEINLVALEYVDCLEVLLQHGAKPDVYNQLGQTPLMKACKDAQIPAVKLLLQYGASVNLKFQRFDKKSVLFYAIYGGNPEVVKLLLEAGADISLPVDSTTSPLSMAVHCNNTPENKYQISELLLSHGTDVNAVDQTFHCTPLSTACGRKSISANLVRLLLEHGADVNFTNGICPSPLAKYLEVSRHTYEYKVVQTLIKYGAIVHLRSTVTDVDPFNILDGLYNINFEGEIAKLLISATEHFDLDLNPNRINSSANLGVFNSRLRVNIDHSLYRTLSKPNSLKNTIRILLRQCLRMRGNLPLQIEHLPLPKLLKLYLLFET